MWIEAVSTLFLKISFSFVLKVLDMIPCAIFFFRDQNSLRGRLVPKQKLWMDDNKQHWANFLWTERLFVDIQAQSFVDNNKPIQS